MSTSSFGIHLSTTDYIGGSAKERCTLTDPYSVTTLKLGEFEMTIWGCSGKQHAEKTMELASVLRTLADDLDKIVARNATVTSIQE